MAVQRSGDQHQYYEFAEAVPGGANGALADRVADGAQSGITLQSTAQTCTCSQQALGTTSEDESTSSIFWLEADIEIVVRGPELDKSDVVTIAEKI